MDDLEHVCELLQRNVSLSWSFVIYSVLEEPSGEKFDADGAGMLTLVLVDQDKGYQIVVRRAWCQGFMRCSIAQVGGILLRMGSLYPEINMVRRLETFKNPLFSLDLSLEVALH